MFLLLTDLTGIPNCETFSVAPSIIRDNIKSMLFHYMGLTKQLRTGLKPTRVEHITVAHSNRRLSPILVNMRFAGKKLSETNTLAYFVASGTKNL